jgi:hypothetical protein
MTEQQDGEREHLDLNNTDFHIWDYGLLVKYQKELIRTVASLKSQIDRNDMRLEFFHDCRDELRNTPPFEKVYDERWRKGVTYSLHLAEGFLAEVTRRMAIMEVNQKV